MPIYSYANRACTQFVINCTFELVVSTSWYEFFLLFVYVCEIFQRSLRQLIFSISKLSLFPGIVRIIISFGWCWFVFFYGCHSLISWVFWLFMNISNKQFWLRNAMSFIFWPWRLCSLPFCLLDETAHFIGRQTQTLLFFLQIFSDIVVDGVGSRCWFWPFFIFVYNALRKWDFRRFEPLSSILTEIFGPVGNHVVLGRFFPRILLTNIINKIFSSFSFWSGDILDFVKGLKLWCLLNIIAFDAEFGLC